MDWKMELANKINNEWNRFKTVDAGHIASIIAVDYVRKLGITELNDILPMLDNELVALIKDRNPFIIYRS
jgi:hypothetical protein